MGVPPPPSQRHVTADVMVHQEDAVYETRLPEPVPPPPQWTWVLTINCMVLSYPRVQTKLTQVHMNIYQTTLPTSVKNVQAPRPPPLQPVTMPKEG